MSPGVTPRVRVWVEAAPPQSAAAAFPVLDPSKYVAEPGRLVTPS